MPCCCFVFFFPNAPMAYSAQPFFWAMLCGFMTMKLWSSLPSWDGHIPLVYIKPVLKLERLEELSRERGEQTRWGFQKWVWLVNLCCPNFYPSVLETRTTFLKCKTILFALYCYSLSLALLYAWKVGSWPMSVELWHYWKNASIKPRHGMFWDL